MRALFGALEGGGEQNAMREKGQELVAQMEEDKESTIDWPEGFFQFAVPAYLKAVQQPMYFLSCDELLWLAECAQSNVIVTKRRGGSFHIQGS